MRKLLLIAFLAVTCLGVSLVLSCGGDDDDDDADDDSGDDDASDDDDTSDDDTSDDDDTGDDDTGDDDTGEEFTCEGDICTDGATGLTWQNGAWKGAKALMDHDTATTYCQDSTLAGFDDWRLPTISELRSLIRGCGGTAAGGGCGVTDECLSEGDCWNVACYGCDDLAGPGSGGAYWPEGMSGEIDYFWSTSLLVGSVDYAWGVNFGTGSVYYLNFSWGVAARCVR